ncbi:SusC/RagA family TonB-linked outer membrane protein [Chryseobacterium sp. SSA4.19]|uniref:SusC/RagA family TonB-linked outer membrane protein n=1 Tax=Chryseobacterium sp. SSA4.19 TaxID=2919915 RepID=UPI001F4E1AC3|nr:SusC/RagA family TonB-linked outer membrane protein [Chryseobacterium sp. SSA4.19]MCJ8152527.1 SusC/RagA family TonB-linked outer membrane protein [Chryseobacterium sp. SSA4.19]
MNVKLRVLSVGALFFLGYNAFAQSSKKDTIKEQKIEEVVVVAYGTQKKQSITGSITTINAKQLEDAQSSNAIQSLTGKVGGVQISANSGQPGDPPQVRFRGIGSLSSSNNPLYVVDGVPYNGNINAISNQDIETISFLKDASANALYGSRGANGVVLITTKKAKKGRFSVTFDTKFGVNSRAVKEYDIITDPGEYYEVFYNRLVTDGVHKGMSIGDASTNAGNTMISDWLGYNNYNVADNQIIDPATGKINRNAKLLYHDDWNKNLFKDRTRQEYNINVSNSSEKNDIYLSLGYLNDEGYVINSGFKRYTARLNNELRLTSDIKVGVNLNYARSEQNAPIQGTSSSQYSNLFSWARNIAPIYPIWARDTNGNFLLDKLGQRQYDFGTLTGPMGLSRPYGGTLNPYGTTLLDIKRNSEDNLSGRAYASINFLKDFNFTYNLGYDLLSGYYINYSNNVGGDAAGYGGSITNATTNDYTVTNQQLLNWNKSFGKHSISAMIGHETSDFTSKMLAGSKTNIAIPDLPILSNATKFGGLNGYNDLYKVEGFLSRVNYNYDNKYFVNASFRRDGSSVFAPENRWGNFFGLGAAWVITNEDFLKSNDVINNLKIKGSYGEQGNDNILYAGSVNLNTRSYFGYARNYYAYASQFEIVPDSQGGLTIVQVYEGNRNVKWEVSKNLNAGFELSLFNRINIDAQYFERGVKDMIYNKPLAPSTGTRFISENIGDMKNRGVEVSVDADIFKTQNFSWNLFANITYYKNEITFLPNSFVSGLFKFDKGVAAYTYYLREFAGVDATNGDALWYKDDANGNKVTTNDYTQAKQYLSDKTLNPKAYGGFGTNVSYKGINITANFAYQFGGYMYDNVYQGLLPSGGDNIGQNYHKDVYNTWTPTNTSAALPALDLSRPNQMAASDLFLIKSDYISLQDASISYDFNKNLLPEGLTGLRFGLYGTNLAMWSKRKGMDPRLTRLGASGNNGVSLNNYGVVRSISMGLTVKF